MTGLPFESRAAAAIYWPVVALFVIDEIVIAARDWRSHARRQDRGTKLAISLSLGAGVVAAVQVAEHWSGGTLPWPWVFFSLGVAIALAGIALRVWAVASLGRWFTTTVRVAEDQVVVTAGPYRWVRHPSYLGLLVILLGLGLGLTDWLSVLLIVVLPLPGLLWRISVEERALGVGLGSRYTEYAAARKRLVPGVW